MDFVLFVVYTKSDIRKGTNNVIGESSVQIRNIVLGVGQARSKIVMFTPT